MEYNTDTKMSKYHVCFVAPNAYPLLANKNFKSCGGAEVQQVLLGWALKGRRYKVTFVVDDYGQPKRETIDGIEVVQGPFRYFRGSRWHFPVDTLRLIWTLRRINADIYIFKGPLLLMFSMGWHRRLFGRKLVKIIAHDEDCTNTYNGEVMKEGGRLDKKLYLMCASFLDYTIFQSEYQKKIGLKNLGLRGRVIKNIAQHRITPPPPQQMRDIGVLWVGTALRRKRPHLLLDVAEQMPDVHFTMIIAPGPDIKFTRSVKERAISIKNVDYKGFIEYSKIGDYYDRARVLAHTSKAEGFPNVFLQAWQSGVPVVALSINPDGVIKKSRLGRVSGDIEKFKDDILFFVENEIARRETGRNGMRYIRDNHETELIVQQYIEVFNELLKIT